MNDDELRDRWREETGNPRSDRDGCPSPEVLLELAERGAVECVDDDGSRPDRNEVLLHLARCPTCREDVAAAGALFRAALEEETGTPAPGGTGPDGKRDTTDPRRRVSRRRLPLALAASVVLAVGVGVMARWVVTGGAGGPVLRGGDDDLVPAAATCLEAGIVELRWAPVPGAVRYRIEVFTDVGDLVLVDESVGTSTRLALPQNALLGGVELHHMLEAELADGSVVTSPANVLPPECHPPR